MIGNAELIAIVGLAAMLFISGVGAAYALGSLPRRSEFRDANDKNEAAHKELADKIEASHKELSDKIEQSHANLIAEIRRSHQQVMRALINHRHLEPDGEPIFTEPPDTELVAADN
ncbi:MAG: hypothetical protein OXL37_15685 [Chloroflexota bacterium]|nr:hypothetical protein [Chloroflexota bacterium]MDE2961843.1 hypothetical protein [Chloroflexota bacterium]